MCFPLISLTRFSGYNVHKEGQQKPNRDPRHAPEENEGNHDSRNHKPLCKPECKQVYTKGGNGKRSCQWRNGACTRVIRVSHTT